MANAFLICLVVLFVVGWSMAFEILGQLEADAEDAKQMLNILYKSRAPSEFHKVYDDETGLHRLLSFEWSDCGQAADVAHIKSISLSPDPLQLPGNITVAFQWETTADLTAPISLDIKLEKKISIIWITVPCDMIPGGCQHANICDDLSKETCPPDFEKCHCPFKKGTYVLTPTKFLIKLGGVPSGDYKATAWLKQGNTEVGCVYLKFAVA